MPLVTSTKMLKDAQKGNYAVGAFNAENMEMVKAIIQAAEELKAPVMIQTTPSTISTERWRHMLRWYPQRQRRQRFRYACTLTMAIALSWRFRQ